MVITYSLEVFQSYKNKGNNDVMPQIILAYNNKRKIIKDEQTSGWRQYEGRSKNKFVSARMSQPDDDKLYDAIRTKLNKIARDNFDEIIKEISALSITSIENLIELVNIIIDKAIYEKLYVSLYAKLCNEFMPYVMVVSGKKVSFKEILVTKCQTFYVSYVKPTDTTVKETKIGFMTFLGWLYIENVITYTIINSCLSTLIKTCHTINGGIEMMIALIRVIGKTIHKENRTDAINHMKMLKDIIDGSNHIKVLPMREKFMIMDIMDLSIKEKW